jgi:hypothetical protein
MLLEYREIRSFTTPASRILEMEVPRDKGFTSEVLRGM